MIMDDVNKSMFDRRDKVNYYLDIAETVASRSTCIKELSGAVIVKDDQIISTGYVGAPRGRKNCTELEVCNLDGGDCDTCRAVHAEMNAIVHAPRMDMTGAVMYLVKFEREGGGYLPNSEPCSMCKKVLINSGIESIYIRGNKDEFSQNQVYMHYVMQDDSLPTSGE